MFRISFLTQSTDPYLHTQTESSEYQWRGKSSLHLWINNMRTDTMKKHLLWAMFTILCPCVWLLLIVHKIPGLRFSLLEDRGWLVKIKYSSQPSNSITWFTQGQPSRDTNMVKWQRLCLWVLQRELNFQVPSTYAFTCALEIMKWRLREMVLNVSKGH